MPEAENQNKIILFDGVCNLCNSSVNFIIDHDKKNVFKFTSLQSDTGQKYLRIFNAPKHYIGKPIMSEKDFDTMILVDGDKFYTRSTAALRIAKELSGVWKFFYIFIIVPKFIRDFFYNVISKNRYSWFGKRDSCRIPTPELKEKFLE